MRVDEEDEVEEEEEAPGQRGLVPQEHGQGGLAGLPPLPRAGGQLHLRICVILHLRIC